MQEETSSDEETDTKERPGDEKTANSAETMDDKEIASPQVQNVTESVRQRRNRHICEVQNDGFTLLLFTLTFPNSNLIWKVPSISALC